MTLPHRRTLPLATLRASIGSPAGTSRWFDMPQALIDRFAEATEDAQFIHVDPVRAAATPFGGTVAHGFLTLSMLSAMAYDAVPLAEGTVMGVNYGFDRVRFLTPVPAGARIRGHFTLDALEEAADHLTFRHAVEVEIAGAPRPALAAIWITRGYLAPA